MPTRRTRTVPAVMTRTETVGPRGCRAGGGRSGPCRRLLRRHGSRGRLLVVPGASELRVVAVLANTQLALRARSHVGSLSCGPRRGGRDGTYYNNAVRDCVFCRIIARESPADIEYEDDE